MTPNLTETEKYVVECLFKRMQKGDHRKFCSSFLVTKIFGMDADIRTMALTVKQLQQRGIIMTDVYDGHGWPSFVLSDEFYNNMIKEAKK